MKHSPSSQKRGSFPIEERTLISLTLTIWDNYGLYLANMKNFLFQCNSKDENGDNILK